MVSDWFSTFTAFLQTMSGRTRSATTHANGLQRGRYEMANYQNICYIYAMQQRKLLASSFSLQFVQFGTRFTSFGTHFGALYFWPKVHAVISFVVWRCALIFFIAHKRNCHEWLSTFTTNSQTASCRTCGATKQEAKPFHQDLNLDWYLHKLVPLTWILRRFSHLTGISRKMFKHHIHSNLRCFHLPLKSNEASQCSEEWESYKISSLHHWCAFMEANYWSLDMF